MPELPTACVIGAGSSGIAAVKALYQAGIAVTCYEKSDTVGGNWVFGNKNGMSAAYRSLHINTSRGRMEYSDFPMPASYPDFPHHTLLARYFDDYTDHFGFRDRIVFNTGVEHCERRPDGVWDVTLEGGETRQFDALLVANGHHWDPRWPEPPFPGEFGGELLHAHHFVDASGWAGKTVVVLGMGNSAMDIACEASYVADRVILAARRGAWILPKYMFGRPLDQIGVNRLTPLIPFACRRRILELMYRVGVGDIEELGLPKPDHRIGDAHPTVSADMVNRVAHGAIEVRPNIAALEGDRIRFEDGSVEPAEVLVYCTGYKVTFPFFDEHFISAPDNELPLFKRVYKPDVDNVFFIGLCQPLGAIMPLAEEQGTWVAAYLRGEYALPPADQVREAIESERRLMRERYVASKRHTMQVDFDNYLRDMQLERKRGYRRARERRLPRKSYAPGPLRRNWREARGH